MQIPKISYAHKAILNMAHERMKRRSKVTVREWKEADKRIVELTVTRIDIMA